MKNCPVATNKTVVFNIAISMIRPILEYASPAWSAYSLRNITKLAKVQRQSAHLALNDYSSLTTMLDILLDGPTRKSKKLTDSNIVYKILHNQVTFPLTT